jgi:hypothetical protein
LVSVNQVGLPGVAVGARATPLQRTTRGGATLRPSRPLAIPVLEMMVHEARRRFLSVFSFVSFFGLNDPESERPDSVREPAFWTLSIE